MVYRLTSDKNLGNFLEDRVKEEASACNAKTKFLDAHHRLSHQLLSVGNSIAGQHCLVRIEEKIMKMKMR